MLTPFADTLFQFMTIHRMLLSVEKSGTGTSRCTCIVGRELRGTRVINIRTGGFIIAVDGGDLGGDF